MMMSCVWLADVLAEKLMLLGMYLDTNSSVFITTEYSAVGNVPGHKQQRCHYHRVCCCWECIWAQTAAFSLPPHVMLLRMYLDTNSSVFITTVCDAVGNVPGHKQQRFHYHRMFCCWECTWTQTAVFSLPQSVMLLGMYLGTNSSVFITTECAAVGNVPGDRQQCFHYQGV